MRGEQLGLTLEHRHHQPEPTGKEHAMRGESWG